MLRSLVRATKPAAHAWGARTFQSSVVRFAEAASSGEKMFLNFTLPHKARLVNREVDQIVLPGVNGEFGVSAGHVNNIAQLKAGEVCAQRVYIFSSSCVNL